MKTLYVLRHAKSAWDDPTLDDHDRQLAPRGRKAATAMAGWLERNDVRPEHVLCSPAVRARQTLELVHDALGASEVTVAPSLYHGSLEGLRREVAQLPHTLRTAMLIGHNPGLHELVLDLGRDGTLRDRVVGKLPTGALVAIQAPGDDWGELAAGGAGEITAVVLPREL